MPRSSRAVLLDLDDTLYPHRRFILSGFRAVADRVHVPAGVSRDQVFRMLVASYRSRLRGRELDALIEALSLRVSVGELVAVIRRHSPALRLAASTRQTLVTLRRSWSLAIVTNGRPETQAAKIAALGLDTLVDTVVHASQFGSGSGKPDREPFLEALRRLRLHSDRAVFVGDDEQADIFGAARCGLRTIQTRQWRRGRTWVRAAGADAVVSRITDVPAVAEALLPRRLVHHAA